MGQSQSIDICGVVSLFPGAAPWFSGLFAGFVTLLTLPHSRSYVRSNAIILVACEHTIGPDEDAARYESLAVMALGLLHDVARTVGGPMSPDRGILEAGPALMRSLAAHTTSREGRVPLSGIVSGVVRVFGQWPCHLETPVIAALAKLCASAVEGVDAAAAVQVVGLSYRHLVAGAPAGEGTGKDR